MELQLPSPPPSQRIPRWMLALGASVVVATVAAVVIGVVTLWALVTGGATEEAAGAGGRIAVSDSRLTLQVPYGWSGRSTVYYPLPSWMPSGLFSMKETGLRQDATVECTDTHVYVSVFADQTRLATIERNVKKAGSPRYDGLTGTAVGGSEWHVTSYESTTLAAIRAIRLADSARPGIQIFAVTSARSRSLDKLRSELLEVLRTD